MLKIDPSFISKVNNASTLDDLFEMLQKAIELEHATIPPYLTALFSFKPGTGGYTGSIIHSIVIEEMLHMTIAANILNALGGSPVIDQRYFVPAYPTPLPMGIGHGLIVGLEKYSLALVKDIFMEIEEPENPLVLKKVAASLPDFNTIGQFYIALQQKIDELAPDVLPGDASKQVTSDFFSTKDLFPIIRKEDAINAINIIIEQGEGTSVSPVDPENEIAHYYKFEELSRGRKLKKDSTAPYGYSFTGDAISFDPANVYPIFPNTKAAMLTPGSEARRIADEFNASYSSLLNGLHRTFNGEPAYLSNTIGVMYDLKLCAAKLCAMPFPGKSGFTVGPGFEWVQQS